MADYTIGLEGLADLLRTHEKQRQETIKSAIDEAAAAGVGVLVRAAPKAAGHLRQSFSPDRDSDGTATIRADAPYSAAVEVGARPHFPPLQPLIDWITKKAASFDLKRSDEAGIKQTAFLIARKISEVGIAPTWFVKNQIPSLSSALKRIVEYRLKHK